MIKTIEDNKITYAKIIKCGHKGADVEFFTDESDELQFGVLNYKKDYKTGAHYHSRLKSKSKKTDEILILQKGSARVDFYNDKGEYLKSAVISAGDIIIIYKGGHNVVYLEDTELFMIKPGPYDKETDKTRIIGTNNSELIIEE